ncbi:MAG TPA: GNAT family N-acetyltransferase [Abditibacterium sp.]|jgi:RimJ/RimL family protein N-acetyltransferase
MKAVMETMRIETTRLEIIAATPEIIRAEIGERERLTTLLGASVPPNWPPEFIDLQTMTFVLEKLESGPEHADWWTWYVLRKSSGEGERVLMGVGGFKGPPDAHQSVEIGYSMLSQFQNQGYASEAVSGMVDWAFAQNVESVSAETLPELSASIRVLEKNGFTFQGEGSEPGVIGFRKDKSQAN